MRALALAPLFVVVGCVLPGPHADTRPEARDDGTSFVDVGGAWLRVLDTGPRESERAPVVLVHGYGSRLEAWRELVPELSRDRRVVAFDQRGFGLSEKPDGDYGPEVHTADLLAIVDALSLDRPILIGHSYGGGVVLRAALARTDAFRGMALVSTFAFDESVPPSFRMAKLPVVGEILFGAFYEEVPGEKYLLAFHDTDRFVTVEALDEMKAIMAQPGAVHAAMETVRGMDYAEHEAGYRSLTLPTVIVWGERDRVVPLKMGKRLASTLDRELVVLEDAGHMPMWERPQTLLRALRPLLDEGDRAPPPSAPVSEAADAAPSTTGAPEPLPAPAPLAPTSEADEAAVDVESDEPEGDAP